MAGDGYVPARADERLAVLAGDLALRQRAASGYCTPKIKSSWSLKLPPPQAEADPAVPETRADRLLLPVGRTIAGGQHLGSCRRWRQRGHEGPDGTRASAAWYRSSLSDVKPAHAQTVASMRTVLPGAKGVPSSVETRIRSLDSSEWYRPAEPSAQEPAMVFGAFSSGPTAPRPSSSAPESQELPTPAHRAARSADRRRRCGRRRSPGPRPPRRVLSAMAFPAASYGLTTVFGPCPHRASVSQANS